MVRKSAMRVLVVMGLLVTGAGCSVLEGDSEELPDLVVGATLELSGPNREVGEAHQRALKLQETLLNQSGAAGERKVRVAIRDNGSDPGRAAAQVTEFANDPGVSAVIVGACSECGVEAAKVANQKQIPLISLAPATEIAVPQAGATGANFVFRIGPNSSDNARALLDEVNPDYPRAAKRNIGVLYPDDVYGNEAAKIVGSTINIATSSVKVVGTAKYKADGSNLGAQARALVADKPASETPQAVMVWALPAQAVQAAEALRAAEYEGPIFFDSAAAGGLFLTGPAVDGATMVFPQTLVMDDVIATTPAKAARKQFFEDYTARYGAYHGQASFAADALEFVATAVNQTGSTGREAVRGVIEGRETDGLSGPLRVTPVNHSALMPQALATLVVKGGRWRLVG